MDYGSHNDPETMYECMTFTLHSHPSLTPQFLRMNPSEESCCLVVEPAFPPQFGSVVGTFSAFSDLTFLLRLGD